jgi:hypothetical protein
MIVDPSGFFIDIPFRMIVSELCSVFAANGILTVDGLSRKIWARLVGDEFEIKLFTSFDKRGKNF